MKSKTKNVMALLVASSTLVLSGAAMATNGYFTHGVGTESKGMAGTGIGSNSLTGPIAVASNPALGVFASDDWEVGLSFFSPMRSYEASSSFVNGQFGAFTVGEAKIDSGSEWFPIPYVAKNWRMSNGNALSVVFYGRGGMNTDWDDSDASAITDFDGPFGPGGVIPQQGPFGGGDAGVDLSQAFLTVNYAGKAGDNFAWGLGPVFAVQAFEAKGVVAFSGFTKHFNECFNFANPAAPFCDPNPTALTNNGHEISTGIGFSGGVWFALSDSVSAGLAYQSKIGMSEFDDYADLFAEAGGFDIPSSAKLGLSFKGNNNVRLNIDIEHTQFSEADSVGNPLANIAGCPSAGLGGTDIESCLGGKNGAGFGWDDMTTYKFGVEWAASDTTTWRMGYSYGEQPIHEADVLFNILAPGVMEQHITFGMTRSKPNGGAWNFSLMYAPETTVEGLNMFDTTQTIELEMKQLEFEVSYLW